MSFLGARRWWALGAITLAVLAVGLDVTVLSLALPTLAAALKATESDLQWFSSGYALVLAAAMLPAGLLGDRYGRKKVLLVSLALFAVGSLACAESRTATEFLIARLALGLAGAGVIVMAISALAVLFSEEERPRAVAVWGAANFLAFPIGPILGGWLLTHFWWGWVFLLNVPVAAVGSCAVVALVPETRAQTRPGHRLAGRALVERRPGRHDLWADRGRPGTAGVTSRPCVAIAAGWSLLAGFFVWERRLATRPGVSRSSTRALLVGLVHLGRDPHDRHDAGHDRHHVHHAAVLPGRPRPNGTGLRPAPAEPRGRPARRRRAGRPPDASRRRQAHSRHRLRGTGRWPAASAAQTSLGSHDGFVALWMAIAGAGVGITLLTTASAALSELRPTEPASARACSRRSRTSARRSASPCWAAC